ncbi:AraC family transcriptional regulator [Rubinisphaera italica]|uniref:Xylose operon regulatory protein n=1 Tax=Rubinisphaera italica TaxID=2527969 RepID=A0A5C5XCZ7_9PLAN|nr:AraC family transcriptional regulator [Rubinisphaera italica]TWT60668.1 Xylose operon regulatory protein [Rubinisphaera italica]
MTDHTTRKESFVYVPVTETQIKLGLYLTGSGTDVVGPDDVYPHQPHPELYNFTWNSGRVLPEYQFVFIAEGTGEFESKQTGKIEIKPGTMMILFPDVWHRYRPSKASGWTEYWISVNGDLIFDWQQRGILSPLDPVHHLQNAAVLIKQYNEIIRLITENPRHQPTSISARVLRIITEVLDQMQPVYPNMRSLGGKRHSAHVIAAMTEIWNHSHWQLSVSMVADRVGVNRRTLERLFEKEVGHTIHNELTKCRLDRATRMLIETQVPIKSVAYASGFSTASTMSRVFQRELNISPTEYRRAGQQVTSLTSRRNDSNS